MDINSKMLMAEIQSVIDVIRANQARRIKCYTSEEHPAVCYRELSIPTVVVYTEQNVQTFYKIESKVETIGETKHLVITSVKPLDPAADRSGLPKKVANALAAYETGKYENDWTQVIVTDSRIVDSAPGSRQDDLALLTERRLVINGKPVDTFEQRGYTWSVPLFQSSLYVPDFYANIFENWIKPFVEACDSKARWKYSFSKYLVKENDGLRVRVLHKGKLFNILCTPYGNEGYIRLGFMYGTTSNREFGWTLILPGADAVPDETDKKIFTDFATVIGPNKRNACLTTSFPFARRNCSREYDVVVPYIYCGTCRQALLYSIGSGIALSGLVARVYVSRFVNEDGSAEYEIIAKSYLTSDVVKETQLAQQHPEYVAETSTYTLRRREYRIDASCDEERVVAASWSLYDALYEELHSQVIWNKLAKISDFIKVKSEDSPLTPIYTLHSDIEKEDDVIEATTEQ